MSFDPLRASALNIGARTGADFPSLMLEGRWCRGVLTLASAWRACAVGCEAHGVCASDLSCVCHPGWSGEACDSQLLCAGDCSNHGLCLDGVCSCDAGYSSFDCAQLSAPQRPPPIPEIR